MRVLLVHNVLSIEWQQQNFYGKDTIDILVCGQITDTIQNHAACFISL